MTEGRASLFPFRCQINVTFPARGVEDAGRVLEAMAEALEPWSFLEHASVEKMDEADVIPDSPLAEAMGRE